VRLKWLGCLLILLSAGMLGGCSNLVLGGNNGNGNGGPQPTSISVTVKGGATCTKTSPCGFSVGANPGIQLEATATFANGATQNYTSAATWTASPSDVVTLSQSSGIENVVGAKVGTATITATSTNSLTSTAVVTVNPAALSSVTVTPMGNGMSVGTTANYVATANFSDGSTQVVTTTSSWSASTTGVASVGASTGAVTAEAPGQTTITASYEGVNGSTALNVVSATGAYTNASLSGNYAFTLTTTGTNASKQSVPEYFVGSLSFDGKSKVTGVMDSNVATGTSAVDAAVSGTYSIFADGRGSLTLNATGLPSSAYRLVLTSNLWGTTSGQFIQFDGKGSAIGTLVQQASPISTTLGASEVFRLNGVDAGANPLGEVGVLATSGTTITSGEFDENDFGVIDDGTTTPITVTGGSYSAVSSSTGRGTLTLNYGSASTSKFVFYTTQSGNLILLCTDAGLPALGSAEAQSGTLTTAFAPQSGYGFLLDRSPALQERGLFDTVGRIAFDGAGGITGGAQDEVSGVSEDSISSGTYTVATNGRTPVTITTTSFPLGLSYVYYVISANRAYVLNTTGLSDPTGPTGAMDIESGISESASILEGNYGFAAADLSEPTVDSVIVWMSSGGAGNVQGIGDVVSGSSLSSVILSGTYTVADPIGRITILPTATIGAESYILYVVSPCEAFLLGVLPSFDGTVLNQTYSSSCPAP